jgi:hypothetical protein
MKNYLKIFVAFVVLIVACKKDKTPFPFEPPYNDLEHGWYTEDCSNSWPEHWVDSFNMNSYYVDDHVVFKTPQFNPSNPDEIVYYHINYPENIRQLVKYNLKTTEKTVLTNGLMINGEPSWSITGKIAFSILPEHKLYVVNDNGSGLGLITQSSPVGFPTWMPNGECIIFTDIHPNMRNLVKKCLETNSLDTLIHMDAPSYYVSVKRKISKDNLLLIKATIDNTGYYAFSNLNDTPFSLTQIHNYVESSVGNTDFFCWSHDSQYIYLAYYATGDIYKVHVATGQIEQLRSDCFGRWLNSIDASPDGKYLVVEKVNLRFTILPNGWASSAVRMQSHITLIDLQTGQMKDLDLE